MYTFSVACANLGIRMTPNDIMFTRGVTEGRENDTLIAHYCCDHIYIDKGAGANKLFTQKRFDKIDKTTELFPYLEPFRRWRRQRELLVKSYMSEQG